MGDCSKLTASTNGKTTALHASDLQEDGAV